MTDATSATGRRDAVLLSVLYDTGSRCQELLDLRVKDLRLDVPPNVHFVKAVPSQLRLTLESQVRREVGVQPRFVGAFQPGYSMESYKVEPEKLVIVGPESRMALVDHVTTDPIDVSTEIGAKKFQATAYVPDPNLRFEGASSVSVEVFLRKRD